MRVSDGGLSAEGGMLRQSGDSLTGPFSSVRMGASLTVTQKRRGGDALMLA
jgi:hypothetical protein